MLDLADLIARLDAGDANNDEVLRVIASHDWLDRVALESLISGLPDTASELVARFASFEGAMVPVIGAQALGESTEHGRLEYVCTTPEDCRQLLDELPSDITTKLRWGRASGRAILEDAPRAGFAGLCLNPADPGGRRGVISGEALDAFLRDSSQKT